MRNISGGAIVSVLLAIAILWCANLDYRKLIRPDEGRYAEIAREMAITGDWVTPRLNGIKYFEKPPLQYWITAGAYKLFGVNEWTARLWPALAGLLCALVVWRIGLRWLGEPAGHYAGLVSVSMLWPVANAHINTLDMGLTFFLTLALGAFLRAQMSDNAHETRQGMLLAWAACAGAVLSKGLTGLVIPAGAIVFYVLAARNLNLFRRMHWIEGAVVIFAICAPWFVAVSVANPEFARFFFIHEHFERFLTTTHRRTEPWWFFLPLLIAGALPWTLITLRAVARATQEDARRYDEFRPRLFLLCWCAFVLLFFSVSKSKLPSYILPMFPALAWLTGERMVHLDGRRFTWLTSPMLLLGLAVAVAGFFLERFANERTTVDMYRGFEPWVIAGGAVMAIATLLALWQSHGRNLNKAYVSLALGSIAGYQLIFSGHEALNASFSGYRIAEEVRPNLRNDCPMFSIRAYDQTLPFYLERTLILVEFEDEMAFGLKQEPQLAVPSIEQFRDKWLSGQCAYAYVEPEHYAELDKSGLPMSVLARDTRRVIVANAAAMRKP